MTETFLLPPVSSIGNITVTNGSTIVEMEAYPVGSPDMVTGGLPLMIDGQGVVAFISTEPVGSPATFELIDVWSGDTATAEGFVFERGIGDEEIEALVQITNIGTFAERSTFNAQTPPYSYLSTDGAGGEVDPHIYERQTIVSGTWVGADQVALYVDGSTVGDDTNDGRSPDTPLFTIQAAINLIAGIDLTDKTAKIFVAAATYSENVILPEVIGFQNESQLFLIGDTTTPTNVVLSVSSGACISATNIASVWNIRGLQLGSTNGTGLEARKANMQFQDCRFAACGIAHIRALAKGVIEATGNYSASAGGRSHVNAVGAGAQVDLDGRTLTLTASMTFSQAFAWAKRAGHISCAGMTFTNKSNGNGRRFFAEHNGVISTAGAGKNYLPGSSKGLVSTGAQYE